MLFFDQGELDIYDPFWTHLSRTTRLQNAVIPSQYFRATMSEETTRNLFDQSTQMYRKGDYQSCLTLLNHCILLQPARSILFSNRSIANFHLDHIEQSFQDLSLSIRYNHLNYIAYFNLFSLHMVQQHHRFAFDNLCHCLSAAYTYICRYTKTEQSVDKALYYSANNKEALFLKAVLRLENGQLEESMGLLKVAIELEHVEDCRRKLVLILNHVEGCLRRQMTFLPKRVAHDEQTFFELKNTLECPEQSVFLERINALLYEFNAVYQFIYDSIKCPSYNEIPELSQKSIIVSDNKSEANPSINKEDKMLLSSITINNSNSNFYASMSDSQKDNPRESVGNCLFQSCKDEKELNIHSTVKNMSSDGLQKEGVRSDDLYPIRQDGRSVKIFVSSAQLFLDKKYEDSSKIYTVLCYDQTAHRTTIRTSLARYQNNTCRWQEWSNPLELTEKPSNITFKIYNKKFTAFRDTLIGSGEFEVNSIGQTKIPIYDSTGASRGELQLTIRLQH